MDITNILIAVGRFALPVLGCAIAGACAFLLLRQRPKGPPGAYLLNAVNRDKLPLTRWENSLGRAKHCDVVLNYDSVSRYHAVIARRKAGWVVIDTGSKLGTRVDGLPIENRAQLRNGQRIAFGMHEFLFCEE